MIITYNYIPRFVDDRQGYQVIMRQVGREDVYVSKAETAIYILLYYYLL